ncbi:AraC family transcriptional regulator [Streptomyces sp. NPDC047042]|uniref:AraC family transcriptional regulator n=1 Tax=Streptomyces sp. NPDC047042 TaxID=3154807 RepID=UPI00340D4515
MITGLSGDTQGRSGVESKHVQRDAGDLLHSPEPAMPAPGRLLSRTPDRSSRQPDPQLRPDTLRTRDFDEAHDVIASVYVPHELKSHDGKPLDFKFHFLRSQQLLIGHLGYGADAELLVPQMLQNYHLNLTMQGRSRVTQAGRRAVTTGMCQGVMVRPFDDFTVRWSPDALQYAVLLPSKAVEEHLGVLLNRPVEGPIDFSLGFDMTTGAGQGLVSAIRFLRSELVRPGGVAEFPLALRQLESFVLTQLLLAVPHSYSDELCTPTKPAQRNRIKDVIDLVDSQPESDLSLARLAGVAGVSAKSLQVGFREATGITPMAYVRKVRLERVRNELMALAGRRSITDIATHWGFLHLGRFSSYYRQQYGETPTETVRKALRG